MAAVIAGVVFNGMSDRAYDDFRASVDPNERQHKGRRGSGSPDGSLRSLARSESSGVEKALLAIYAGQLAVRIAKSDIACTRAGF